ncbi:MAG: Clp protease [Actinomycetota bacterium]|nr:Clp protease [Actinomycetota bacterium]
MFERFSSDARALVVDAQNQARRRGARHIGCEHLLLAACSAEGLTGETLRGLGISPGSIDAATARRTAGRVFAGIDPDALAAIGIDLDQVRATVVAGLGPVADGAEAPRCGRRRWGRRRRADRPISGHIPFHPLGKKCLELALRESLAAGDRDVRSEHVVLGLVRVDEGEIAKLLAGLGLTGAQVRTAILDRHRRAG